MQQRERASKDRPGGDRVVLPIEGIDLLHLFGQNDRNLRVIQERFDASVVARGDELRLVGQPQEVALLTQLFQDLIARVQRGARIEEDDVRYALDVLMEQGRAELVSLRRGDTEIHGWKGSVSPRTVGQREYARAIATHDLVFCIGPAGTGKTYLAMACAVAALKRREIDRILLVRPAVEAGESLGFLPGDFTEKVAPYLRPLYDALHEMMPADKIKRSMEAGVIEVAPLAYMRGRTLNNSFVILDEAQNTTLDQMKMFLTRLGVNAKAVVTGDVTQIDLLEKDRSGLLQIAEIVGNIPGIRFIHLTQADVVRHRLVQLIVQAFEEYRGAEKADGRPTEGGRVGENGDAEGR